MLHFVVPANLDDPSRPSGGNHYDRRLSDELRAAGHEVREHPVPDEDDAGAVLAALPDETLVLVDGLLLSDSVAAAAQRLRLAVLVHMIVEDESERAVLPVADVVVTTSQWGRSRAIELYGLDPRRVHVAAPGADAAPVATGTPGGGALLCVAAVAEHKGHDLLLQALAEVADADWHLTLVGSVERDPAFVARLRRLAEDVGIAARISLTGALTGTDLERSYGAADVLVHPSRGEMYGLVVTEALAHGLPVIASDVGGVAEALGAQDAGLLVPPDDPSALAAALRSWLASPAQRAVMRRAALERRAGLASWRATAGLVVTALGMNG